MLTGPTAVTCIRAAGPSSVLEVNVHVPIASQVRMITHVQ
jgi:hypothetical protein